MKIINTIILVTCAAIIGIVSAGCTAQKLRATLAELEAHQSEIAKACDLALETGDAFGVDSIRIPAERCNYALDNLTKAEQTIAGQTVLCSIKKSVPECLNNVDWVEVAQKMRRLIKYGYELEHPIITEEK